MMADSTNVMRKGFTPSEQRVGEALDSIFEETESRIIIATFASNVYRVQKIIDAAVKNGRKVAVYRRFDRDTAKSSGKPVKVSLRI